MRPASVGGCIEEVDPSSCLGRCEHVDLIVEDGPPHEQGQLGRGREMRRQKHAPLLILLGPVEEAIELFCPRNKEKDILLQPCAARLIP